MAAPEPPKQGSLSVVRPADAGESGGFETFIRISAEGEVTFGDGRVGSRPPPMPADILVRYGTGAGGQGNAGMGTADREFRVRSDWRPGDRVWIGRNARSG